jgi:hypothetical protein
MLKHYTIVGVSKRNNKYAYRFSNGNAKVRFKQLLATGNTEVILYTLAEPTLRSFAAQQCRNNIDNNVASEHMSACFNFVNAEGTVYKL